MSAPIVQLNSGSSQRAARIVAEGGLVVFPTDTVYGLGCDPTKEGSVSRLFDAKRREAKPVPVLCSTLAKAQELVVLDRQAAELAARFWPGALTIVAPLRRQLPALLHQGTFTLGVRVPAHVGCLGLIRSCGGWLTGTSANISGRPPSRTAEEALSQLGESVDLILDGGPLTGSESTVVKATAGGLTILRTGSVGVPDEMMRRRIS